MKTVSGINYYSPREIAEQGLITNSKGKGDYGYVLRLIKRGAIEAVVFNGESAIPYYMVAESEVDKYNQQFVANTVGKG